MIDFVGEQQVLLVPGAEVALLVPVAIALVSSVVVEVRLALPQPAALHHVVAEVAFRVQLRVNQE